MRFVNKKLVAVLAIAVVVVVIMLLVGAYFLRLQPIGDTVWSGTVNVTGDVFVLPGATLTITPGTIIRVSPVDRASAPGFEVLADGFNDDDPTRLKEYDETHVSITGKIIALGTKENPIVFTSAAENPRIADWAQLNLEDGSRLDYVIVEYLRTASTNGDDVEITNSVFRHAMWGGISLGDKNPKIINNTIHDCGHEGLDVHGGAPYIANNLVYDCNTGIVVISDDLEVVRGHFLKGRSKPVVVNNTLLNNGHGIFILNSDGTFENNTVASPTGPRPPRGWCYKDFCYENKGGGAAVSIEGNSTPVFVNNSFADRAG